MTPEFAILGHPNEGKSSVLSTLAEDDSVRVSSTPGETTECRTFPIVVDGREVLRFTDTPGFQNPARVLSQFKKRAEQGEDILNAFRQFAATVPELHDDNELLAPLARGAGIIYVVDGSRPVRNVDRAEMEILRLTGKPRMAVINCKDEDTAYLADWKSEFRKNFNSNRMFNAHRATYAERISLLEALKSIDQDWQQPLTEVVEAFKKDWGARNEATVDIITGLLRDAVLLSVKADISGSDKLEEARKKLFVRYSASLSHLEKEEQKRIRALFKHNIFSYELPPQSLLNEDLFDEKTWQFLGLSKKQVFIAGGLGGAAIGAGLDVAALGHGLGLFTAVGGVAGALSAFLGGENLFTRAKLLGVPLGGEQLQLGPSKSIELLFVLLNRALLYYQHTINWAHGRRDYENSGSELPGNRSDVGFTRDWPAAKIKVCHQYFTALRSSKNGNGVKETEALRSLLLETLQAISEE